LILAADQPPSPIYGREKGGENGVFSRAVFANRKEKSAVRKAKNTDRSSKITLKTTVSPECENFKTGRGTKGSLPCGRGPDGRCKKKQRNGRRELGTTVNGGFELMRWFKRGSHPKLFFGTRKRGKAIKGELLLQQKGGKKDGVSPQRKRCAAGYQKQKGGGSCRFPIGPGPQFSSAWEKRKKIFRERGASGPIRKKKMVIYTSNIGRGGMTKYSANNSSPNRKGKGGKKKKLLCYRERGIYKSLLSGAV